MAESTKRRITVLLDDSEYAKLQELAMARTGGKHSTAMAMALGVAHRVMLDPSTVRSADSEVALAAYCASHQAAVSRSNGGAE